MDAVTLHARCVRSWEDRLTHVGGTTWDDSTPCTQWSVRDLVNHVVGEDLWTGPLVGGATIEEVGHRFDGDVLGDDPLGTARSAAADAVRAVGEAAPTDGRTVHLSYGEESLEEYLMQLAADHLIHGWDLSAATGGSRDLDPELVTELAAWFAEREQMYRGAGIVGPRVNRSGDAQTDLLAAAGRDADWSATPS